MKRTLFLNNDKLISPHDDLWMRNNSIFNMSSRRVAAISSDASVTFDFITPPIIYSSRKYLSPFILNQKCFAYYFNGV